jgi:outer membrane protein OmpA-like peptidoglycan-associated protein
MLFFCLVLALGGQIHAQTAAEMDTLFLSPAINFAQASRFVLAASDRADLSSSSAFTLARENGWLPKKASEDGPVRLGELCLLLMKAFDIKGSFLYALFPGPHYAFRELDYLRLIPGLRDPALKVSGEWFLQILEMVSNYRGEVPAAAPVEAPAVAETAVPEEKPVQSAAEQEQLTEREQIAEQIRTDLERQGVADTSVRVAEEGVVISLDNIQFMPDSVDLMEVEKVKLREIAVILLRYPERRLLVGGHTAMAGDEAGRRRISEERAQTVADFLVYLQARQVEEITVRGYGAERPLGNNVTAEGQVINRRVEIILLDEGQL